MIGKYIVIEMTNASGKSSAIDATINTERAKGKKIIFLKTPSTRNEAACRYTTNPDKLELANANAVDKAEASIIAFMLKQEGFDIIQDRGFVSALLYNNLDKVPFETTTALIAEATKKIISTYEDLAKLIIEVMKTQTEQGYQPEYKYLDKVKNLKIDLRQNLSANGLIMPDLIVAPVTQDKLVKRNLKIRLKNGDSLDSYEIEQMDKGTETEMFPKAMEYYEKKLHGKVNVFDSLHGQNLDGYSDEKLEETFEKITKLTAGKIIEALESVPDLKE